MFESSVTHLQTPSAYLLVSHGSRDPRPQVAMDRLVSLLCQSQTPLIGTACLELGPKPLHEQIKEFGDRASAGGCNSIQVLPLFLLPGVHVKEDIPSEVAIAQQDLGQEIKINLRPHLGSHPGLSCLLKTQLTAIRDATAERVNLPEAHPDVCIILAHGSRRPGSRQPVEAMATQLGAVSAYWAVPPKLESRVTELVNAGYRQIAILPYFLFVGGITDAIAQSVEQLKQQFPNALLYMAEPLGASAELAKLIMDLMEG